MSNFSLSRIASFSYSEMGSGLDGWKNIAKGIREASRGGSAYPPFKNTTFIDSSKLGAYYGGAAIIAGILSLCFLLTFLGGLAQLGALVCCKKSIQEKQNGMKLKSPPSRRVRTCMYIWIFFIYLFYCLGSFTSYTGGGVLGNSVVSLGGIGVGFLNETEKLVNSTIPNTNAWFDALTTSVFSGVDAFTSRVSADKLVTDGVTPALNNLASTMTAAGEGVQSLFDSGNSAASSKSLSLSLINQTIIDITIIRTKIENWNMHGISLSGGNGYTITNISYPNPDPITLAWNAIENLNDASNILSFLESIKWTSASCFSCAAAVQYNSDNMPSNVRQKVSNQSITVKSNLNLQLGQTRANIISSLTSMRDSASNNVGQGKASLNDFYKQASNYNNSRNTVMVIMSSIILVILASVAYFMYKQKPNAIKRCNLASTPIYVVIQTLSVILFIVAVMIGDVCTSVFETSPAPILSGLPSGELYNGVNNLLMLRDQCSANYSILTIAVNMNLISADSINTTTLCGNAVSAVDFSPLGEIDLSSLVIFAPDPPTILAPLKNLTLSMLNATSLDTLVNITLPALKASLTSLKEAIDSSSVSVPRGTTSSSANNDYSTQKASLTNVIDNYISIGGIIDIIGGYGASMAAQINATKNFNTSSFDIANIYYVNAQRNMALYQNNTNADLLAAIPGIKANINRDIAIASDSLYSNLNCTGISVSLFSFQNAVCGQFLGGLDILWLAYGVISVAAAFSVPVFIWITNRLFYHNMKYVHLDQSPARLTFGKGTKVIPV